MAERTLDPFLPLQWCRQILEDPNYEIVQIGPRPPSANKRHEFFSTTLNTAQTVRASVFLLRRPAPTFATPEGYIASLSSSASTPSESNYPISDAKALFLLGPGLNGYPGISHGGFVATIADEVLGYLLRMNVELEMRTYAQLRDAGHVVPPPRLLNMMTAELKVRYRQPVPTGGVVLVRSWIDSIVGRRALVKCKVEDAQGNVLTEGEGLFAPARGSRPGDGEPDQAKL